MVATPQVADPRGITRQAWKDRHGTPGKGRGTEIVERARMATEVNEDDDDEEMMMMMPRN